MIRLPWDAQQTNDLEGLGLRFLNRIARATREVSPTKTIVQLAWTAGPVTYLALQGGYLLGYGHPAPGQLFVYFAGYTVIAGITAALMRIVYSVTSGERVQRARKGLDHVINRLPDLIVASRDLAMEWYDEESRRLLAARYLLENPDAGPDAVQAAIYDLTENPRLAIWARQIEVYRKAGLRARIRDAASQFAEDLAAHVERVRAMSPDVANLMLSRLHGTAPSKRRGRPRTEGFLERTLACAEEGKIDLMTLGDVEEMLTLAFELIAGRTVPYVAVRYVGSRVFTESSEALERARREYRLAAYARNSRLRSLITLMTRYPDVHAVPDAMRTIQSVNDQFAHAYAALQRCFREAEDALGGKALTCGSLEELYHTCRSSLELYAALKATNEEVARKAQALGRAQRRYSSIRDELAGSHPLHVLRKGERRRGVRLVEESVSLSDHEQREVALGIYDYLQREFDDSDGALEHREKELKGLGVEILRILDRHIGLDDPAVRTALASSRAANLAIIEVGITTSVKAGWSVALVHEVEQSTSPAILRTVRNLVTYHGVAMDESSIGFLAERYNLDPEKLAELRPFAEGTDMPWQVCQLLVPALPVSYGRTTEALRRMTRARAAADAWSRRPR